MMNIESVIEQLQASDVQQQIEGTLGAIDIVKHLCEEVVRAMAHSSSPMVIAEQSWKLGSVMKEPLEQLLRTENNPELIVLASRALMLIGSDAGIPFLLGSLRASTDYDCRVAEWLIERNISTVKEILYERIEALLPDLQGHQSVEIVLCFFHVLDANDHGLPSTLRIKLGQALIDALWKISITSENEGNYLGFVSDSLLLLKRIKWDIDSNLTFHLSKTEMLRKLVHKLS